MSLSDHIKQQGIPQFRNVYIRLNELEQISQDDVEQFRISTKNDSPGPCVTIKYIMHCVQARSANGRNGTRRETMQPPGHFVQALERELSRIQRFVETFGEEVWVSLGSVTDVIGKWGSNFKSPGKGSDENISMHELDELTAQCDEIGDNIIVLDEFLRQNVILAAFLAQRHDQSISAHDSASSHKVNSLSQVSPAYLQAMENYLMNGIHYDPILIGLSDAHSNIRQVRSRSLGPEAVWTAPDKFERKTTKYWVHPADVLKLKSEVIKHLPILIYGKDKARKSALKRLSLLKEQKITDWNLISSVYFDNDALDTYHERIHREHGAALVRLRWYGKQKFDMDDTIFIERKVHRDSWTGETSVKERAPLPAPQVPKMLEGEIVSNLEGDSSQAVLLRDIQKRLIKEEPNLRTEYRRVAFQESSSNEVRMSLDTHLRMIREKGGPRISGEWCRDMRQKLDDHDVIHFPYAVFEIKLAQEEPPLWVQKILDSGIIVEVPKFSKFLHGSALLFGSKVRNTPFWFLPDGKGFMTPATLEEMADTTDTYAKEAASFIFPGQRNKQTPLQPENSTHGMKVQTTCTVPHHSMVLSEVVVMPSRGEKSRLRTTVQEHTSQDSKKIVSQVAVDGSGHSVSSDDNGKSKWAGKKPPGLLGWISKFGKTGGGGSGGPRSLNSILDNDLEKARAKALVRTRIEPKTFFANERTFLSWLSIAIMVMFMGLSLLDGASLGGMGGTGGSGSPVDKCHYPDGSMKGSCSGAKISGALIIPVALVLMVYALFIYRMRTAQILRRENVRYDDQRGPLLLTVLLVVVLVIAYVLSLHFSF